MKTFMNRKKAKAVDAGPKAARQSRSPFSTESVVAEVCFPMKLDIERDNSAAEFSNALRERYPHADIERAPAGSRTGDPPANVLIDPVWRLREEGGGSGWEVALSGLAVLLRTGSSGDRGSFLERFAEVTSAVQRHVDPAHYSRVGLRNAMGMDSAAANKVIREAFLGQHKRLGARPLLAASPGMHMVTDITFRTEEGFHVCCTLGQDQARALEGDGLSPEWELDLDVHAEGVEPFRPGELVSLAGKLCDTLDRALGRVFTDWHKRRCGAAARGRATKARTVSLSGLRGGDVPATYPVAERPLPSSVRVVSAGRAEPGKESWKPGTAAAVSEIRSRTGLTWEQVGSMLGVSRRTVHNWHKGARASSRHKERINETLRAVERIWRGTREQTRAELMAVADASEGVTRMDLLRAGRFSDAAAGLKGVAGHGPDSD